MLSVDVGQLAGGVRIREGIPLYHRSGEKPLDRPALSLSSGPFQSDWQIRDLEFAGDASHLLTPPPF